MRNLFKVVVALAVASPFLPCLADDITNTSSSSSSSESIEVKKGVKFKFRERLHDLHEKIDTAVSRGWISSSQASSFGAEADRLVTATSNAEAAGWPQSQVDSLEKSVTKLNADVASASSASGAHSSVKSSTKVTKKSVKVHH